MRRAAAVLAMATGLATAAAAQDLPTVTIAVQTSGTVNWEIQTILHHGLDAQERLRARGDGRLPARRRAQVAFLGGEADVIVSDWILGGAAARRGRGPRDHPLLQGGRRGDGARRQHRRETLADLKGEQIGIAGGPVDKSWIILRALALRAGLRPRRRDHPGLRRAADRLQGRARRRGGGGGQLLALHGQAGGGGHAPPDLGRRGAARELGLDPDVPLLGYVVQRRDAARAPGAGRRPRRRLARGQGAARHRRRRVGAAAPADERRERRGVRQRCATAGATASPRPGRSTRPRSAKLLAVMAELGGEELVGQATTLPEGVFAPLGY